MQCSQRTFLAGLILGALAIGLGAIPSMAGTVSGVVQSGDTGEPLAYATVQLIGPDRRGKATDLEGGFRFEEVPTGIYELRVFYIGYADRSDTLQVASADSLFITVLLESEAFEVPPVIVKGERNQPDDEEPPGFVTLGIDELKSAPSVGETDPIRSLQLLPGVQAASDISSGLYIRGGGPDQTLILLDRVPVYNPNHAFGLFSTFNADAVEDVRLYKGAYPAEYTGRLGSVLDVRNREGNREKVSGVGGISTITGRMLLEGPIGSGSWIASGRRTYLDPILNSLRKDEPRIPTYYFYDLNGGLTMNVGDAGVFRASGYHGWDEIGFDLTSESFLNLGWGNSVVNFRFNQLVSRNVLAEFQLSGSEYRSTAGGQLFTTQVAIDNRIRDFTLRGDLTANLGESHVLRTGISGSSLDFTYRQTFNRDVTLDYGSSPRDISIYLEDEWRFPRGSVIRGGIRTRYFSEGDQVLWEPRLSGSRPLSESLTLKLGGGIYHQYVQLVASEGFAAGDFYFPVDKTASPGRSWQAVGGLNWRPVEDYEFSGDLYFTDLDNLLTFDNNATLEQLNPTTDDIFLTGGSGYATGMELFAQKRTGRLRGWIGYTLGWTRRTFDEVNEGNTYAPKYDRRHDFSVVGSYRVGPWTFAASLVYGTGQAYTPAVSKFGLNDPALGTIDEGGFVLPGDKNSARLIPYNRMDVSVTKKFSLFGLDAEWFVQAFNLYNRSNEWFIQYNSDDLGVEPEIVYQLPVIPSLGVNFAF